MQVKVEYGNRLPKEVKMDFQDTYKERYEKLSNQLLAITRDVQNYMDIVLAQLEENRRTSGMSYAYPVYTDKELVAKIQEFLTNLQKT